ncbi:MAG: hypothetical protein AAF355_12525 [Myxococcota bacterium]
MIRNASFRIAALARPSSTGLLMACPLFAGCSGAAWGNLIVLGVTIGIFFGTLSLGRSAEQATSERSASARR